jgi:integrase
MSRPPKPWYWKARRAWFTDLGGSRRKLVDGPKNTETKRLANLAFHRLMEECLTNPPVDGGDPTVASIVDEFLEYSVKRDAPSTFYERKLYLQDFCTHYGPRQVRSCKPFHLGKWVDSHPTWVSNWTKHYAMRCVMRPFNWAKKMKLIEENPFVGVEWPTCDGQRRPMTTEEYETLLEAAGKTSRFGEILRFLWSTGCRPSELRHLRWQDVHLEVRHPAIVMEEHKTSRTQRTPKPRVVPLVREVVEVLSEIADREEHDEFVFVTHRRTPWARSSIQQTLRRLRRRIGLPEDIVLYGCRIHVGTCSIRNGNDLRTTADLLGQKNLRVTERYVHPTDQIDQLAAAMHRATKSA